MGYMNVTLRLVNVSVSISVFSVTRSATCPQLCTVTLYSEPGQLSMKR